MALVVVVVDVGFLLVDSSCFEFGVFLSQHNFSTGPNN